MLIATQLSGFGAANVGFGGTLKQMIDRLSLGASLDLCLDAGASTSYDGSSQTWTDISGNSNNFYRGSTSGADATDPTFNGSSGALSASEYFSSDGADFFIETAGHTFAEEWHQDNAAFAIAAVFYHVAGAASILFNNCIDSTSGIGIAFRSSTSDTLIFRGRNGSGSTTTFSKTSAAIVQAGWNFVAGSLDEASGAGFIRVNGTEDTFTSTYTDPSASGSSAGYSIGSTNAGAANPLPNTGRIAGVTGWSRFVTGSEMARFYQQVRYRFPTIP